MDVSNFVLFTLAAIVLLGSPGPAIAALVAVGRARGLAGGLAFYGGLQAGLALAAAVSAAGLFSLLQAVSGLTSLMTAIAAVYLVYLAYRIATAPVGNSIDRPSTDISSTAWGGFLLGLTNPKAYAAFVSIMAAYLVVPASPNADATLKWAVCVAVMIVVDAIWLWLGDIIRRANLSAFMERLMNYAMAAVIVLTAVLAFR